MQNPFGWWQREVIHGSKLTPKPISSENSLIGTVNGEMEVTCPIYKLQVKGIG